MLISKLNDQVHIALTKGSWHKDETVLVRVNSTLVNNDIIGTLINNPDDKLGKMFDVVNNEKKGALVFINQEYNTYDLIQRLKELKKHQETQEGNLHVKKMDDKDFGIGAQILHNLNIHKIKLISNNDSAKKRVGMVGYGLEIVDHISY